MNFIQQRCVVLAHSEIEKISLDKRGRISWLKHPKELNNIIKLFLKSKLSMNVFSKNIGMSVSVLSRFNKHRKALIARKHYTSESDGDNKSFILKNKRRKILGIKLLANNSIEIMESRIIPYGTCEHKKLLKQLGKQ